MLRILDQFQVDVEMGQTVKLTRPLSWHHPVRTIANLTQEHVYVRMAADQSHPDGVKYLKDFPLKNYIFCLNLFHRILIHLYKGRIMIIW